jgi:hypothetical protein
MSLGTNDTHSFKAAKFELLLCAGVEDGAGSRPPGSAQNKSEEEKQKNVGNIAGTCR